MYKRARSVGSPVRRMAPRTSLGRLPVSAAQPFAGRSHHCGKTAIASSAMRKSDGSSVETYTTVLAGGFGLLPHTR